MAAHRSHIPAGAPRRPGWPASAALAGVTAIVVLLPAACAPTSTTTSSSVTTTTSSGTTEVAGKTTGAAGRDTDEQTTDTVTDGTTDGAAPVESADGATLPIQFATFADGYRKPTVMVSVGGGSAVPVLIDTGSTGLRILASAAGKTGVTSSSTSLTQSFADGTEYTGTLATTPATIGGLTTPAPIDLMLIDTVGCVGGGTGCPTPTNQALVTDDKVYGTLGVSLAPPSGCASPIYSPLLQLPGGSSGYTISSGATSGSVVLGNTPSSPSAVPIAIDSASFTRTAAGSCSSECSSPTYPNGSRPWDTSTAQLCWSVSGGSPVCGRTTFDTGSEDAGIATASFPGVPTSGSALESGLSLVLTAPGSSRALWSLTTGTTPGTNRVSISSPASYLVGTTGSAFYFSGAVTFDAENGRLLITP
jgi:hypothetical protein